jgi:DNA-binding NtrC family response regulator
MKSILIIDDDNAIRSALSKLLVAEGYQVLEAANPEEAIVHFNSADVDLIVLDLNLPEKSGWDLFETFTGTCPLVPVIIVTGRPDQRFLAKAAGVGALFEKPIDVDLLLQTIPKLISEKGDTRLRRRLGRARSFHYSPGQIEKEAMI